MLLHSGGSRHGPPFRFMGNVRNDGYIGNLPRGCCVEVPPSPMTRACTHRDRRPAAQCAALCMSNVNSQMLAAQAALTSDPELAVQAVAMDPLTSSVCTLNEIREMCTAMLEAQRAWLPALPARASRRPAIVIRPTAARDVRSTALRLANASARWPRGLRIRAALRYRTFRELRGRIRTSGEPI